MVAYRPYLINEATAMETSQWPSASVENCPFLNNSTSISTS